MNVNYPSTHKGDWLPRVTQAVEDKTFWRNASNKCPKQEVPRSSTQHTNIQKEMTNTEVADRATQQPSMQTSGATTQEGFCYF